MFTSDFDLNLCDVFEERLLEFRRAEGAIGRRVGECRVQVVGERERARLFL